MSPKPAASAVVALLALTVPLLAGCSDDAGSDGSSQPSRSTATDSDATSTGTDGASDEGSGTPGGPGRGSASGDDDCDVEATVTGDESESWTGTGSASTENASGPDAFYQATHDDVILSVYSTGADFSENPALILQVGEASYAGAPGGGLLDVHTDGSGADIDVDLISATGTAHVKATFSC